MPIVFYFDNRTIKRTISIDDVRIKSGKVPVLNDEVLRVLKTMGKWKPGIEKNKPCRSLIEIPFVFQLACVAQAGL